MGRTLTIAFSTGLICLALSACGDDSVDSGVSAPGGAQAPTGQGTPPPNRMPSSGQMDPDFVPGDPPQ